MSLNKIYSLNSLSCFFLFWREIVAASSFVEVRKETIYTEAGRQPTLTNKINHK